MYCEGNQHSRHDAALFLKNNFFYLGNSIYIFTLLMCLAVLVVTITRGGLSYMKGEGCLLEILNSTPKGDRTGLREPLSKMKSIPPFVCEPYTPGENYYILFKMAIMVVME